MNLHNAIFLISVFDLKDLPQQDYPEIVFAGRSNVGKSSMINKLLNRKNLARTSSVPGKTACINYYNIDNEVFFTDIPGYGYAKVSNSEKTRWGSLLEEYFSVRTDIKLVILLLDIRRKPTEDDLIMLDFLDRTGIDFIIVLTKSDKLSNLQQQKRLEEIKNELNIDTDFVLFSAQSGTGREEILNIIGECLTGE